MGEIRPAVCLTPRTVRDLCLEVNLSKQRVWILIKAGRVPAPLKVSTHKWVYSQHGFQAAVAAIQSGRKDRETQQTMRHRLRIRREAERARKAEDQARLKLEKWAARRGVMEKRLSQLEPAT